MDSGFDPIQEGVDAQLVHKVMHVRDQEGVLQKGLSAFITIWKVLPRYRWLSRLANTPIIRPILEETYAIFAKVRPYLPRKSRPCNIQEEKKL